MRLQHYTRLALLGLLPLTLWACADDDATSDDRIALTVRATSAESISDYSAFTLKLSSLRDGKTSTVSLGADGSVSLRVDKGSYGAEVSGTAGGKGYTGSSAVAQYASDATIEVPVSHLGKAYMGDKDGLVLKELFYNGGTYGGTMMHPDQYVVLANNSDHDIYLDSLVISQCSNMNTLPCDALAALLPDHVAVSNMYMIPGDGKTYLLRSGEVAVVAASAIDHSRNYDYNADKDTGIPVNLSGADFELADEDASQTGTVTDNPSVPNLVKISNSLPNGVTGWMHPYGIRPVFIFDAAGVNWDTFKQQNALTYKDKANVNAEVAEYQAYKVPTALIVDGVETTSAQTPYWGGFTQKSLPAAVDKSYAYAIVDGGSCHSSTFMFRLSDTDDSSVDMQIEHRSDFEGYPLGWRTSGSN